MSASIPVTYNKTLLHLLRRCVWILSSSSSKSCSQMWAVIVGPCLHVHGYFFFFNKDFSMRSGLTDTYEELHLLENFFKGENISKISFQFLYRDGHKPGFLEQWCRHERLFLIAPYQFRYHQWQAWTQSMCYDIVHDGMNPTFSIFRKTKTDIENTVMENRQSRDKSNAGTMA